MSSRIRCCFVVVACTLAAAAAPAAAPVDRLEIEQLEQDVRQLRRTVAEQARRLQQLEQAVAMDRPARPRAGDTTAAAPTTADESRWLEAGNWAQLRTGLPELEVVALLGAPSSMRTSDDGKQRTLFYVLEIGASGFLVGNVVLEDRRVVAFEEPRLR